MTGDVSLVLRYKERGFIGTKTAEENVWCLLDDDATYMANRQQEFEAQIKKAIAVFSKKNVYDVELTLYENINGGIEEKRLALLTREVNDRQNDVYTLYTYFSMPCRPLPETDINKVSKEKALSKLSAFARKSIKNMLEKQSA